MSRSKIKNIVVIGGGTGTYTVLRGLKKYPKDTIALHAIISVSDSGGSTGRLRDEFGILPVGDFRMALAALSSESGEDNLLRELFLYRFSKGEGLSGHNFGNLFLVAMTDILGSEVKAIAFTSKILRIRGKVIPITTEHVVLHAEYTDGSVIKGEAAIDDPPLYHDGTMRITQLWLEPHAALSLEAKKTIAQADLIVLGPGDLYSSTLSNVVVLGAAEELQKSNAMLIYIMNLMCKHGQTHDFSATDHVLEITTYVGRKPDYIVINDTALPKHIVKKYKDQNEFPVVDNITETKGIIRGDFLASEEITKPTGDVLKRSLIRHDSDTLAKAIMSLI